MSQIAPGRPHGDAPRRSRRIRAAWLIAIAADIVEIVLMPMFAGGFLSPANDVDHVVVCVVLVRLLGWHPAFLPTFVAELVPGLGLFPTWTLAVAFAARAARRRSGAEVVS